MSPVVSALSLMSSSSNSRLELIRELNALTLPDFEALVFALNTPRSVIPSREAALGNRTSSLLEWAEGPTGCGLDEFRKVLDEIINAAQEEPYQDSTLFSRNWAIPLQMPPLPDHFVERPEHQDAVKARLLSTDPRVFGTLVVSAIYGLGGIGKSVLASKLAHDDDIQSRFADGILWVTLGQNPDLLPLLSAWIQALGDHDYKPTALQAASIHLRTLLYDKKILLVVDDVWNPEHLEPFRVGGSDCCVLVTTREARIPEAHRYDLDVMSPDQALELMTQKLSEGLSEEAQEQALAFAKRVGYLPLALELAATQIEEGVTWAELLEDFQEEVARIEGLDLYGQEDIPDDAKRRKYSLLACFNLSLKQLSTEQLRQFAWLGVVPEDVNLTQEMAMTLWQVTARQAGAILRQFGSKALLLSGVKQQDNRRTYRLHDLMHDLAQRLLVSPPQPIHMEDLPGLGLTKAEAHHQLLESYRAKTSQGQWHTLKDDGYIYDRLTWHMEQARRPQEVHRLFQETTEAGRNGWYEACNAIGKLAGFVNDVGRGWRIAQETMKDSPGPALVHLFRYALIRTSLNSLASNIPAELVAALVKHNIWQPAQGLAYAQQMQDPWRKAECISVLVSYIPQSLLPEVLSTVAQIKDAVYRSFALSKLAEQYSKLWPSVLEAIAQINDRYGFHRGETQGFACRAHAIEKLTPLLPPTLIPEVLTLTRQIENNADQAYALRELAKVLPELMDEALEVTRQIKDESSRVIALSELAKVLPELMDETLEVTRAIQIEPLRARVLSELAKVLPPELMDEALEVTRQIQNESSRAHALSALVTVLPPELMDEALEVTRQIKDESYRAHALRELAKVLPELMDEALEVTRQIKDESSRVRALSELSKVLPKLMDEALEITGQIQNEYARVSALKALAQVSPPELIGEVLEIIRQLQNDVGRARALRELAQVLPPKLMGEALEITQAIQIELLRARVLGELAQVLPPDLVGEALEVTRAIQDEFKRARVLSELATVFPKLMGEALEIIRAMQSESSRASMLKELAKVLPPELMGEALEITQAIQDESNRADVLSALTQVLPPELMGEALGITQAIQDESNFAYMLRELAQVLPPELMGESIEITQAIQSEFNRAYMLSELAQVLPPELMGEALKLTQAIQDEYSRAYALIQLAKVLPNLIGEVLDVTRAIQDESSRAIVLSELAKVLSPDLMGEALEITQAIKDESNRADALSELAKVLPPYLMGEALEIIQSIKDESNRADALSELAKVLPPDLMGEALEITQAIKDEYYRASVLSELAKVLPPELMGEALEVTRQIKDESSRAKALSALAKVLPDLMDEVLEVTRSIQSESSRVRALSELAKVLPPDLMGEALEITQAIKDESYRARVLSELAKVLPDLMYEALEATRQIKDESSRAKALSALAQVLTPELMDEVLEATRQIKDESSRAKALSALVKVLPKKLLRNLLIVIQKFEDRYYCASAWQGVLLRIEELSPDCVCFVEALDTLAYQDRKQFLGTLPKLRITLTRLGGENTVMDCLQVMKEVCEQWP